MQSFSEVEINIFNDHAPCLKIFLSSKYTVSVAFQFSYMLGTSKNFGI